MALNDLSKGLNAKSHCAIGIQIFSVVLFHKFSEHSGISSDGISFPLGAGTRWLGQKEMWDLVHEATEEHRDTEWSNSTSLGVFLFVFGNTFSNVL